MCYCYSDLREEGLPFISLERCHNLPENVFPQPPITFLTVIFFISAAFLHSVVFFFFLMGVNVYLC